jgi:ABC-type antimicrobial peptide transport system permease subunit
MIGFGLRLSVAGREARVRLAVVGAAVTIGVALLLTALAGINAVQQQNQRYAWLNSAVTAAATGPEAKDPVLWSLRSDYFHGHPLGRIDVAVSGPDGPVPPGIPALPGPGEFYVSPALGRLLASTPPDQLGDRWPGHQVGVFEDSAMPSPDSLIVVVGRTTAEMAQLPNVKTVTRMVTVSPSECNRGCYVGINGDGVTLVLAVVAAALLFPLLMFIGTATRLSAARREQRFAAMRLVGATPRQISVIATAESTIAAVAGTIAGLLVFLALRNGLAGFTFTSERFFPSDLSLRWTDVLLVGLGVPVGAAIAARASLRQVRISPLGVTRRARRRSPGLWRLLPLVAGLAELAYFVGRRPRTTDEQTTAYLSGILTVMIGLVVAGPYLTMVGSRLLAWLARRPATLIAGRRLADDPRAGFRAVSGLMLALFVTTAATGIITTIVAVRGAPPPGIAVSDNMTINAFPQDLGPGRRPLTVAAIPQELRTAPGVTGVAVTRLSPADYDMPGAPPTVIACADLERIPGVGHCAPGVQVAQVFSDLNTPVIAGAGEPPGWRAGPDGLPLWQAATVGLSELAKLPVVSVVVATDGSDAALEHARTSLERAFPDLYGPATEGEYRGDFSRNLVQWQRLADVVIICSLVIAGCSLAVSVTGGLSERKRPFAVLRLTGMRLGDLRRVVALESAVPLLAVSALAIGVGFVAAGLFLRAQLGYRLQAPGGPYYVIVVLGLLTSLGIIASTMPLLKRITGPETARNE